MGYCHRHSPLFISLIFFLISSSTQVRFMAEGRTMFKFMEEPNNPQVMKGIEEKKKINERVMIGSRPPRCEMRCNSCRHCEAVQVPAVPQNNNQKKSTITSTYDHDHTSSSSSNRNFSTMRGDDTSNYKPMSWKCKCGDMIFNP